MLFNGEEVGDGNGPDCDVAVDPIDGTTLMAKGMPNAVAVMAVAERGTMYDPSLGVLHGEARHRARGRRRRRHHRAGRLQHAGASRRPRAASVEDVTVCILDRPRHEDLVRAVREAGARITFISDGDVAGAVMAASEGTGVDLLLGIGGTPEGIITACAVKCLGGMIQAQLWPQKQQRVHATPRPPGSTSTPVLSHRRPGPQRQRLLRGDRHHRRRAGARACATAAAAPPRSRSSCAASPARSAASPASTGCPSCGPTPRSTSSTHRLARAARHLERQLDRRPAPPAAAVAGGDRTGRRRAAGDQVRRRRVPVPAAARARVRGRARR